jgi:hypothetical protein
MAIQITDQFWVFSMAKQIENCRPIYSIVLKFYFFIKQVQMLYEWMKLLKHGHC